MFGFSRKKKAEQVQAQEKSIITELEEQLAAAQASIAGVQNKARQYENEAIKNHDLFQAEREKTRRYEQENQDLRLEINRLKAFEKEIQVIRAQEKKSEKIEKKLFFKQKKLAKHLALLDVRVSSLIKEFKLFIEGENHYAVDNYHGGNALNNSKYFYHGNGDFSKEQLKAAQEQQIDIDAASKHILGIRQLLEELIQFKTHIARTKALCLEQTTESTKLQQMNNVLSQEILVEYKELNRARTYKIGNKPLYQAEYERILGLNEQLLKQFAQKEVEEKHIEELNEKQLHEIKSMFTYMRTIMKKYLEDEKNITFFYKSFPTYAKKIDNIFKQITKQLVAILTEDERAIDKLFAQDAQEMRQIEQDFAVELRA